MPNLLLMVGIMVIPSFGAMVILFLRLLFPMELSCLVPNLVKNMDLSVDSVLRRAELGKLFIILFLMSSTFFVSIAF
jgi:hypothetical protein